MGSRYMAWILLSNSGAKWESRTNLTVTFCWKLKGSITVQVPYDHDFYKQMLVKLHCFFTKYFFAWVDDIKIKIYNGCRWWWWTGNDHEVVVEDELENELVDDEPEVYCYCKAAEMEGLPVISCYIPDCPIEWFSLFLLGYHQWTW